MLNRRFLSLASPAGGSTGPYNIEYLVVAGGGGGYYSGGGGGGYRTNVLGDTSGGNSSAEPAYTVTPGTVYTITVGGGGPGGFQTTYSTGIKGGDSTFGTITSTGGGKASNLWTNNGFNGGSGGGSNVISGANTSRSGGTGIAGQGFRGGNASNGAGDVTCGGGGAGGPGGDLYNNSGWKGTAGGAGLVSSIDGLSITRSAGGVGFSGTFPSQPYGPNTGAGGVSHGGNGLSGVVILRMPTSSYSGVYTGSPVITTLGTNTVLTFKSSGTYTA